MPTYPPDKGMEKLTQAAEKLGLELLSTEWVGGSDNRYLFRCTNQFHPDFEKSFAKAVNAGQGCHFCSRNIPASPAEAAAVLLQRGYRGEEDVHEARDKIWVTCIECGIRHHAPYSTLRRRVCAHLKRSSESPEVRVKRALDPLGGVVLEGNLSRLDDRWLFRCKNGHEFWQTARRVAPSTGQPVRFCYRCDPTQRMPKVTIEDLEKIVSAKGGRITELPSAVTARAKIGLVCNLGHPFEKDWEHLTRGQWCAICSKGSKSEEIARVVFQALFGQQFKKVRPEWLRYPLTGRLLELDGYNEELKIAFEYQGAQHRDWQIGNEGKAGLQRRLQRDEWKRNEVRARGVSLVELWDTTRYEDFGPEIRDQLRKLGREFDQIDFNQVVSFDSAFIRDDRLIELRAAVEARDITLLSTKWIGVHSKYDFACDRCDHRWSQEAASYVYKKVAGCEKCGYKTGSSKRYKGLSFLQDLASKHEGQLISNEYVGVLAKYRWKCKYGHEFDGIAANIDYRGTFCTKCGLTSLDDLRAYAHHHGGTLLSSNYERKNSIYRWRCDEHGEFERRFSPMQRADSFCLECDKQRDGLALLDQIASGHGGESLNTAWSGKKGGVYRFKCHHGIEFDVPGYALFYRGRWCGCL